MFNMMESAFMRVTMAQVILDNAQERYNRTVEKYGRNSADAAQALKQLEMRTNYLNMANMRANVSMGLMITQLALQSNLLDKASLAQVKNMAVTMAATAKEWLHIAALKVRALWQAIVSGGLTVPLMVGGAIAAGVTVGALASPMLTAESTTREINIQTEINLETDVDAALNEQNRRVKEDLRSARTD